MAVNIAPQFLVEIFQTVLHDALLLQGKVQRLVLPVIEERIVGFLEHKAFGAEQLRVEQNTGYAPVHGILPADAHDVARLRKYQRAILEIGALSAITRFAASCLDKADGVEVARKA